MSSSELEIVRWYTSARRFPRLIGRFQDGRAIPGGPYTQTQFIVGAVMIVVAAKTPGLWAHFGLLGNAALLLVVVWSVVWSLGRLPTGGRNPVMAGKGLFAAASAPPVGKLAGRRISVSRPHAVSSRVSFSSRDYNPTTTPSGRELIEQPAPPAPVGPATVRPSMTAVQTLLASAERSTS